MKKIPLSGELGEGKFALVDDEDFERLSKYKWYLHRAGYAYRTKMENGKRHTIVMHREVMNAPDGVQVDHINFDGLDNRKANLRIASHAEQQRYKRASKNSKSRFKGVVRKGEGVWAAKIKKDGKTYNLGHYASEIEAAKAYNDKAKELFGEFAYLNPVPDDVVPKKLEKNQTSKYIGVALRRGKWKVIIDHKVYGTYATEIEAAKAYNDLARELFGESAKLNDVPDDIVPRRIERKKTSIYRGVLKRPSGKWEAWINRQYIGRFDSEIEAAKAYNAKALELYGDKAKLNIIPEEEESAE